MDSEVNTKIDNMYSLLIKANDKIGKLHTEHHEKASMLTLSSLLEKISQSVDNTSQPSKLNNIDVSKMHEWSMQFDSNNDSINVTTGRPSILVQQSIDDDILTILRNSEARTWDTLDRLSSVVGDIQNDIKKFMSQNDSSSSYESNNGHSNLRDQQISSPLIDSIKIDTLQQIQNKCDNIERNVNSLVTRAFPSSLEEITSNNTFNHTSLRTTQSSQQSLDDFSSISSFQEQDGTNAVHVAGIPLSMSSNDMLLNDVQDNVRSSDETDAARTAGISSLIATSAGSQPSASSHNATDWFSNSILMQELNTSNNAVELSRNDEFDVNSQPAIRNDSGSSRRLPHQFHLSRISTNTTTDMIYEHIRNNGISDTTNIKVTKLVPLNRDISTLSFISFKIDTTDDIANIINTPKFWPRNCKWKVFVPKTRPMGNFGSTAPFLGDHQRSPTLSA